MASKRTEIICVRWGNSTTGGGPKNTANCMTMDRDILYLCQFIWTAIDYIGLKISLLIDAMNREVLGYLGIKFEKREAYAVDYVSELLTMYKETTGLDETSFVSGRGHRKSIRQKQYEELHEYLERLKSYAYHIETCGEERNSYSKNRSIINLQQMAACRLYAGSS